MQINVSALMLASLFVLLSAPCPQKDVVRVYAAVIGIILYDILQGVSQRIVIELAVHTL